MLRAEYPALSYSAALIGWGSDVLGFDSERSTDHNWGPRLQLLLPDDAAPMGDEITAMLADRPATNWVRLLSLAAWPATLLQTFASQVTTAT
jgi:hypothetical protein